MPVLPIEVPQFGGLELRDDPQQIQHTAAIDMLNVDLQPIGRLRARDGYAKFTTVSAATPYVAVARFKRELLADQLLASRTGAIDAINTAGAVIATSTLERASAFVPIGLGPGSPSMYCVTSTAVIQKWDGTAFSTVLFSAGTVGTTTAAAALQSPDNRLVVSVSTGSRVQFSDPGVPGTFGVNNWVELAPGDGETVQNITSYESYLYVFKPSRFFVFHGTSVDSGGQPVFNYRMVDAKVGAVGPWAACAAPNGVYFVHSSGVYTTRGGHPSLVSGALDPLFGKGPVPSYYTGSAINQSAIKAASLTYLRDRLYLSVPTGVSTVNDRTFVYDLATNQWAPWALPVANAAPMTIGTSEELVFSLSSGTNDLARHSSAYTTDAAAAIPARYRTGFITPAMFQSTRTRRGYPWPGAEAMVQELLVDGAGTLTCKLAGNDAAALGSGPVAFGTAGTPVVGTGAYPTIAQGRVRHGIARCRTVSFELSGTAPWSVSRAILNVNDSRGPGQQSAA